MKALLLLALLLPLGNAAGVPAPVPLEEIFPDRVEDHRALDGEGAELEVPYFATPMNVVRTILELAGVGPGDVLYDLGCGDGRIVIAGAVKYGTRGVGVDLDPRRIEESRANAVAAGVEELVEFRVEDIFETDFSGADAVTLYLLPEINLRLRPRLLEKLRPGSRVVSHDHHMGDWAPEHRVTVDGPEYPAELYLWLIPAPVEGEWRGAIAAGGGEIPIELSLDRQYQRLWGTARVGGKPVLLGPGRILGRGLALETMRFDLAGAEIILNLLGEAGEDRISGLALIGAGPRTGVYPWRVSRSRQPEDEGGNTDE